MRQGAFLGLFAGLRERAPQPYSSLYLAATLDGRPLARAWESLRLIARFYKNRRAGLSFIVIEVSPDVG
jgi:hypothetical protein